MEPWEENELDDLLWLIDSRLPPLQGSIAPARGPANSIITEKQLRALTKKHLLMMIRDLERELQRERTEKENLLEAYQVGLSRRGQRT